jgi:hypothetical protein
VHSQQAARATASRQHVPQPAAHTAHTDTPAATTNTAGSYHRQSGDAQLLHWHKLASPHPPLYTALAHTQPHTHAPLQHKASFSHMHSTVPPHHWPAVAQRLCTTPVAHGAVSHGSAAWQQDTPPPGAPHGQHVAPHATMSRHHCDAGLQAAATTHMRYTASTAHQHRPPALPTSTPPISTGHQHTAQLTPYPAAGQTC